MHALNSAVTLAALASWSLAAPLDATASTAGTFRIDQVQGATVLKNGAAAIQKAYSKYNKQTPVDVAKAAVSGTVTANPEQYDSEYLCPVTVGSTTLNLDFDTGSADLWVFSDKLPSSSRGQHSIYKTSSGKKLTGESWKISYGDGSGASGAVYADKVVIGGVTATSQAVEAATSVSTQFVQDTDNDGLVGLAFSSINTVKPQQATTFFDTVKSSLKKALFAADLKKGAAGSYDFGFIDTSKYSGELDYADVDDSQGFWMFTADGYSIGDNQDSTSLSGIADTGTTLLLVDDSVVEAYCNQQVSDAQNDSSQGGYTFPCGTSLPDFALIINGNAHTVPGDYINFAPTDNSGTTCFGGIQSNSGIGFSIFGDIFLKSQYVVFDASQGSPRIGFGQQS